MTFTPFPWKNKGEVGTTKLNRQNLNAAEEAIITGIGNGEIELPGSVVSSSATNTFTKQQKITPGTEEDGLLIELPAYPNAPEHRGLQIKDVPGNKTRLLQLEHYGESTEQGYALEIHNYPNTQSALVIHQYSNVGGHNAIWIDNCGNQSTIKLKLTENSILAPGSHGIGDYLQFNGYIGTTAVNDGVMAEGSAILKSATGAFVNTDINKTITVNGAGVAAANLVTTIKTYISATEVELTVAASTAVAGATYTYQRAANQGEIAKLTNKFEIKMVSEYPLKVFSNIAGVETMYVEHGSAAGANGVALVVAQEAAAIAMKVTQKGANHGLQLTQNTGGKGFNALLVAGQDFGAQISTSLNTGGGYCLKLVKENTEGGNAAIIVNKGTGATLKLENAAGLLLEFDKLANIVGNTGEGTKIGTATTQKLGFWNATPVTRPAAITSPAAELASLKTAVDAIRETLKTIGLTA
jgi:hypothetical protein